MESASGENAVKGSNDNQGLEYANLGGKLQWPERDWTPVLEKVLLWVQYYQAALHVLTRVFGERKSQLLANSQP